ncbi:MAG: flagellar basal body-associated FliL family protein [Thermodesulfobacteriota bacterium]
MDEKQATEEAEENNSEQNQEQDSVQLDVSGQKFDSSSEKVELDLDDAPFLDEDFEEEKPEKEVEQKKEKEKKSDKEESEPPLWKKKWFLAGIALLILLLGGILTYFILREPAPKPPPAEEAELEKAEKKPLQKIALDEFWVPHDVDGKTIFLTCKFSMSTRNERLVWEVKRKKTTIRDAIFYYLKNKELLFLRDQKNADKIKEDILSVINQYLSNGRITKLLIEEYIIK